MKQRRTVVYIASLALLALGWSSTAGAQQTAPPAAKLMTNVKVGDPAPDFTLPDQNNKPVKLSDFRGKKQVVLAFYVLAFTSG
ncbi:MAG: redoxin domain-containing protein [Acidobacteria bacterium]|nr:redoxin domain-containing protein [Acidobacteriota bacterium]